MRPLHLDYQRVYKPVPWAGLLLLLTALGLAGAMGNYHRRVEREAARWEARVEHIRRTAGPLVAQPPAPAGAAARAQRAEVLQANQVLRQLGLPWETLFKAVEEPAGPDIALLALEPDLQKGVIRIGGEARNFDALLAYARQLSARPVFGKVMLLQHQVQQDHPDRPVRFALLAQWKEPAP